MHKIEANICWVELRVCVEQAWGTLKCLKLDQNNKTQPTPNFIKYD